MRLISTLKFFQYPNLTLVKLLGHGSSILVLERERERARGNGRKYEFVSLAALALWRDTAMRYHPDPIVGMEAEILLQADTGGFMMAEREYEASSQVVCVCRDIVALISP